ncbi:Na+/H+ antiporter NhaC family protein [Intestinibacter sp.]
MLIFVGILFTLFILVFSVLNNIFLGYGLTISLLFFTFVGIRKGYSIKKISNLYWTETKKSLNIILILLLIGMLISSWLSSGAISSIIYYSLKYVNPKLFILCAFLITSLVSMLIGTSFGTVSAVGIPLIIIGKTAGINLGILGGAIFSGAYFGDRTSPLSSSLLLLCNLADLKLFDYVKKIVIDNIIPFILCIVFYLIFSLRYPLTYINSNLSNELYNYYHVSALLLLPDIILFVLSVFKVKITRSIPISVLCAFILDIVIQNTSISDFVKYLVFGYTNDSQVLKNIIHGGGIISMLKTCYIIVISCSISGFFSGLNVFEGLKLKLKEKNLSSSSIFLVTVGLGIVNAAVGCSQTIAIILTLDIMKDLYEDYTAQDIALDFSNSAILTPALIPWCIASLVPCSVLGINSYSYIPFAFYLYIVPLVHFIRKKFNFTKKLDEKAIQN